MTIGSLSSFFESTVTGWKVRDHGREIPAAAQGNFTGVLFREPRVGEGLVVFRLPTGNTLMTSPVQDLRVDGDGTVWVETLNSTYRLVFSAPWIGVKAA